jgi:hypothetical protein
MLCRKCCAFGKKIISKSKLFDNLIPCCKKKFRSDGVQVISWLKRVLGRNVRANAQRSLVVLFSACLFLCGAVFLLCMRLRELVESRILVCGGRRWFLRESKESDFSEEDKQGCASAEAQDELNVEPPFYCQTGESRVCLQSRTRRSRHVSGIRVLSSNEKPTSAIGFVC